MKKFHNFEVNKDWDKLNIENLWYVEIDINFFRFEFFLLYFEIKLGTPW